MTRKQALRQAKANLKRKVTKKLAGMSIYPGSITYRHEPPIMPLYPRPVDLNQRPEASLRVRKP